MKSQLKDIKHTAGKSCLACMEARVKWDTGLSGSTAEALCRSYSAGDGVSYKENNSIPERDKIISLLEDMLDILFPGYTGRREITTEGQYFTTGALLNQVHAALSAQIKKALSYKCMKEDCRNDCAAQGESVAAALLSDLPGIREALLDDAQAALEGDPATCSLDEIILAYPGFKCICIHRIAHELYEANIPLLPRVMSEYAHTMTGIDINPGARIGRHFFIDHGTGVVIGETAVIGDNVKLYQGVTLGALSFPKDADGNIVKGGKRHPNIEDNVTIYAESTILGNVTIGHDSVIGGNVWLTEDIPPFSKVTLEPGKTDIRRKSGGEKPPLHGFRL